MTYWKQSPSAGLPPAVEPRGAERKNASDATAKQPESKVTGAALLHHVAWLGSQQPETGELSQA